MKTVCVGSDVVTMTGRGLVGEIRQAWAMEGWTFQCSSELGGIDAVGAMPAGSVVEVESKAMGLCVHLSRAFR